MGTSAMTDTPRKDGPRTEAGRRFIDGIVLDGGQLFGGTRESLTDAILAIEAEAAAGPRDQHGWSAEDYERLAAAGPQDYPCIRCGSPLDDCDYDRRCCDDHDHPYATATETIRALNEDHEAEAAAGSRDDGLDVERLARAFRNAGFGDWFDGYETAGEMAEVIAHRYAALAATSGAAPLESEERS